jgi:hypothetical protein
LNVVPFKVGPRQLEFPLTPESPKGKMTATP